MCIHFSGLDFENLNFYKILYKNKTKIFGHFLWNVHLNVFSTVRGNKYVVQHLVFWISTATNAVTWKRIRDLRYTIRAYKRLLQCSLFEILKRAYHSTFQSLSKNRSWVCVSEAKILKYQSVKVINIKIFPESCIKLQMYKIHIYYWNI